MRTLHLLVFTLLVAIPSSLAAQETRKPVVQWIAILSDEGLKSRAPSNGVITNPTDFEALWNAWRGNETPPRIDFEGHMVVVGTSDTTIVQLDPELNETGDLTIYTQVASLESDIDRGFAYGIAVISKQGIKSIKGSPLNAAGEKTLTGHNSTVWSAAYTPDGGTLATASFDRTVRLWNVRTGEQIASLPHNEWVISVAISSDGKTLASGDLRGQVVLWNVKTRRKIAILNQHKDRVRGLAFTPDGETLASAAWDEKVILWDVDTGEIRKTIPLNNGAINSLTISADGSTGAAVSIGRGQGSEVSLFDIESGRVFEALKPSGAFAAFSPDGKTIVASHWVWDWTIPLQITKLNTPQGHGINGVAVSPNGDFIATAGEDRTVRLWDASTGEEVATYKGHAKEAIAVAFSPDGKSLASTSLDETVRIWPVE